MPDRQTCVDSASTALGVIAAKCRVDVEDADELLRSFDDGGTMASGFMLVSEPDVFDRAYADIVEHY